jgi:hypothetical protein
MTRSIFGMGEQSAKSGPVTNKVSVNRDKHEYHGCGPKLRKALFPRTTSFPSPVNKGELTAVLDKFFKS